MRELLKENDKRRMHIIEYLYEHTGWISYSELSKILARSPRLLREDVTYLREFYPNINIQASHQGIRMKLDQTFGLLDYYRQVLKNNLTFQTIELLFFDETLTVNELAAKLYTSVSTMYRVIDHINNHTNPKFNSYIETNPCRFVGDEFFIRNFYKAYFTEAYSLLDWPFQDIDQEEVDEKLIKIMNFVKSDMPLDLSYARIIKVTVMVNLGRYKHGHLLDGVEDENDLSRVLFTIFNQLFISQKFTTLNNLEMNSNYLYQVFTPYSPCGPLYTQAVC